MLDADLAKIYGYTTKAFNQQVKNNIEKFDEDFMFQLTDEEVQEFSRSKNLTLDAGTGRGHNIKYNPHVKHTWIEAALEAGISINEPEVFEIKSWIIREVMKCDLYNW